MGKVEYSNLGPGEVVRVTKKAALFHLESSDAQHWIPLSLLSTPTAAETEEGATIDKVRVESWFADREELEEV